MTVIFIMASYTWLQAGVLVNSGLGPFDSPHFYTLLQGDANFVLCLAATSVIFVLFILGLKTVTGNDEDFWSQISLITFSCGSALLIGSMTCAASGLILYGRYWAILIVTTVYMHDLVCKRL